MQKPVERERERGKENAEEEQEQEKNTNLALEVSHEAVKSGGYRAKKRSREVGARITLAQTNTPKTVSC